MSDECRPFFGEESAVIEGPRWSRHVVERRATFAERAEARVAHGQCARTSCYGKLEDGGCPICGWSVTEWEMEERLREYESPRRQSVLTGWDVDEYADANVDPADL